VGSNVRIMLGVMLIVLVVHCNSRAARNLNQYVHGRVQEVQQNRVQSPEYTIGGSNPSDAPLATRFYSFEVSMEVGCTSYVGRYQTPMNYLPSVFAVGQSVTFRLTSHVMFFDIADSAGIRMPIIRRRSECPKNRQ